MECKKEHTIKAGTSHTYIGCDEPHKLNKTLSFKCGKGYTFTGNVNCQNEHIWRCNECSQRIPPGKALQHTPIKKSNESNSKMAFSRCINLISVYETEKIHFIECSHSPEETTTYRCGTKIDLSDCNKDHTILCTSCKEKASNSCAPCNNIITLEPGKPHPFVECGLLHTLVNDKDPKSQSFFCAQSITITECTVQDHKIYCDKCQTKLRKGKGGLQHSFTTKPPQAFSTPIRLDDLNKPETTQPVKPPDINETLSDLKKIVR